MFNPSVAPKAPKLTPVGGKVQIDMEYPPDGVTGYVVFVYKTDPAFGFYRDHMYFYPVEPSMVFDPAAPRTIWGKPGPGKYNVCFGALGGPNPMSAIGEPIHSVQSPFASITVP